MGLRPPRRMDRLLRKTGPIVMLHGWLYFQAAKHGATLSTGLKDVGIR